MLDKEIYQSVAGDYYLAQYHGVPPAISLTRASQVWFKRRQQTTGELVARYHRGQQLLDIGCGNQLWNRTGIPSIGLDVSRAMLGNNCRRLPGFRSVIADFAQGLPFADGSMDTVVVTEVLEHTEEYMALVEEIRRVLRPGGVVIASTPYGRLPGLWSLLFPTWCRYKAWKYQDSYYARNCGHCVDFGRQQLTQAFAGMEVLELRSLFLLTLFVVARKP